jgi:hypothetical protein
MREHGRWPEPAAARHDAMTRPIRHRRVRHIRDTSYWVRDAKEMAAIKTILIILIHR